jgi:hypothetical protein
MNNNSSKLSFEQAINQVAKEHGLGSDIERQKQTIQQFHNIPFWRWDLPVDKHYQLYRQRKCPCFNCKIKWPVKNNRVYPLFDYQYRYLSALEQHKLVACIKCRASGISEITLRYMEWLALTEDERQERIHQQTEERKTNERWQMENQRGELGPINQLTPPQWWLDQYRRKKQQEQQRVL